MEETQFISTNNILDFVTAVNNLSDFHQTELPENYGYIWGKSSLMKNMGFERYATGDYFHFPMKEWVTKDFESIINQIVDDLKGFSSDNPITVKDTITIHHFLYSPHYKITLIQDYDDGLIKVVAKHFIENDEITLYFIQGKL